MMETDKESKITYSDMRQKEQSRFTNEFRGRVLKQFPHARSPFFIERKKNPSGYSQWSYFRTILEEGKTKEKRIWVGNEKDARKQVKKELVKMGWSFRGTEAVPPEEGQG